MNKFFRVEWGTVFRLKTLSHNTHTQTDNCVVGLSADVTPFFERQEAKGKSNSVTGTTHADGRPRENSRCFLSPFSHRETVAVDSIFWV